MTSQAENSELLRIDTGGWAAFHKSVYISGTIKGILVNHTSNERSFFSLSYDQYYIPIIYKLREK